MLGALLIGASAEVSKAEPPAPPTFYPATERIVAIGDVHGDLGAARRALRLAGAIDASDRWSGGDLVVVQTGDQLDRGEDEQEILDWFDRLTEEARAAGGAFLVLNGNHELMNAELDLRYVTEGGYLDFEDAVELEAPGEAADSVLASYDPAHRARVVAFRPGGPYARLLSRRNVVVQVGRSVFIHGGLLPQHLAYGVERLNAETRAWLRGEAPRPDEILAKPSPVWSRHYSDEVDAEDCAMLAEVLEAMGADRMVVGHTVQDDGVTSYCDDRVWCIDVGMAEAYGGPVEVLEIRGDTVTVLREK